MVKRDWEGLGTVEENGGQMAWTLHTISDLDESPEFWVPDSALSPMLADVADGYPRHRSQIDVFWWRDTQEIRSIVILTSNELKDPPKDLDWKAIEWTRYVSVAQELGGNTF